MSNSRSAGLFLGRNSVKLVTTTLVRGSSRGESHGGAYLIDLDNQAIQKVIDWNGDDIDRRDHEGDRGLRGIAFDDKTIYIAASEELLAFDTAFKPLGSWRCPHLKYCQEIAVYERNLYLASGGYDSIIAFDLDKQEFHWALHLDVERAMFKGATYDPNGDDGPLQLGKMRINNVHPCKEGMYISGEKTHGLLHFSGERILMSATLPDGVHNARPFRDGMLFNDSEAGCVRYVSRDGVEDRKLDAPAFGRGLCVISDHVIASGSSPATISIHDLEANSTLARIELSTDICDTIHGLEVWPYD